jgi:hypothetical protein
VTGINGGDTLTVGFGHGTVLSVADKVIDAVKAGRYQALLPRRRMRRCEAWPQLLHRVREAGRRKIPSYHARVR